MEIDFEKLHEDSRRLLEDLADRLPPDAVDLMRSFSDAGEWSELAETLCAALVRRRIAISRAHRDALAALLDCFGPQDEEDFPYLNHKASTIAALTVEN